MSTFSGIPNFRDILKIRPIHEMLLDGPTEFEASPAAPNALPPPAPKPKNAPRPEIESPDLLTPLQAATKLQMSVKTLNSHVAAGEIRYVLTGRGKKRPRRKYTQSDLDEFIENRKRREAQCLSTKIPVRHTGNSAFKSEVVAFSARPKRQPNGPRKP